MSKPIPLKITQLIETAGDRVGSPRDICSFHEHDADRKSSTPTEGYTEDNATLSSNTKEEYTEDNATLSSNTTEGYTEDNAILREINTLNSAAEPTTSVKAVKININKSQNDIYDQGGFSEGDIDIQMERYERPKGDNEDDDYDND